MRAYGVVIALLISFAQANAVTTTFLEDKSAKQFKAGTGEDVVISNMGTLSVALRSEVMLKDRKDVSAVYAIGQLPDGTVIAGTGPNGIVLKYVEGKWDRLFQADQPYIVSLAIGKTGKIYAGTAGSAGKIFEISPDGTSKLIFSEKNVKYIWALTLVTGGKLLAATGPQGKVFQIDRAGAKVVFTCKQKNVIAMARAPDGSVYIGTDTSGILYLLEPKGDKIVSRAVYDANEDQIAAITTGPDGIVYFATASGRAAPGQAKAFLKKPAGTPSVQTRPAKGRRGISARTRPSPVSGVRPTIPPGGPGPAERKMPTKDNAIYRLDRIGFVTEVFRDRLDFCCLAYHKGALYTGTWPEGRLFEIYPDREEIRTAAKADAKFVYSIACTGGNELILATGSPGGIVKLGPQLAEKASFTSRALDAEQIAHWGKIVAECVTPAPHDVCAKIQTRTGAVKDDKDPAWSEWSTPQCVGKESTISSPPARFIQYKITFAVKGNQNVVIRNVKLAYMQDNQPPHITSVQLQTPGQKPHGPAKPRSPGQPKARQFKLAWKAKDPNGDKLTYNIYLRLVGTTCWVELAKDHKQASYSFDPTTVPDAEYQFKVVASDRLGNPADFALTAARISDPVIVDNTAPVVTDLQIERQGDGAILLRAKLVDKLSEIAAAYVRLNGQKQWQYIAPADEIYDSLSEQVETILDAPTAGPTLIAVKVLDRAGNTGFGQRIITRGKGQAKVSSTMPTTTQTAR